VITTNTVLYEVKVSVFKRMFNSMVQYTITVRKFSEHHLYSWSIPWWMASCNQENVYR